MSIKYINLYYQFFKEKIQKSVQEAFLVTHQQKREKGKIRIKKERKAKREKGKWGE